MVASLLETGDTIFVGRLAFGDRGTLERTLERKTRAEDIRWTFYPRVAAHSAARASRRTKARVRKSAKTVDAYARNLEDMLKDFKDGHGCSVLEADQEEVERYVERLHLKEPRTRGSKENVVPIGGSRLSPATIRQRVVTARLFFEFCILRGFRQDPRNPVIRGASTLAGVGGRRGLVPNLQSLPWIPGDEIWERIIVHIARNERLRNQTMFLLAYEGALRRQELLGLRVENVDLKLGLLSVPAELSKTGIHRTVTFSAVTATLLSRYLTEDRAHIVSAFGSGQEDALFVSESNRNAGAPLRIGAFNDVIARIRREVGVPQLKPHTLRHLRCTVLRRCGVDLQDIALYAVHASTHCARSGFRVQPGGCSRLRGGPEVSAGSPA